MTNMVVPANQINLIVQRWQSDSTFPATFRADPAGTLSSMGITLAPLQQAALSNIPWNLSDDDLLQWAQGQESGGLVGLW